LRKSYAFFLSLLLTLLLILNLVFFSKELTREKVTVGRVIDGDTFELKDGRVIRLLNINAPEKNLPQSDAAKSYLSRLENSSVELEVFETDKYERHLARVYSPEYTNLYLVKEGMSSKFLVQDKEIDIFSKAEEEAIRVGKGIWKHSNYYGCFTTDIDKKKEVVYFIRTCNISSMEGWIVKDESRKTYSFSSTPNDRFMLSVGSGNNTPAELYWDSKTNIWNNDRDSLYLFDKDYSLVHYHSYGY